MKDKKKTWLVILAVLALLAAACGDDDGDAEGPAAAPGGETTTSAASDEPVEMQDFAVGVYPGAFLNLVEYVTLEEGFFEDEGLDVELVNIPSGPEQIAALASGSIDVMGNTMANFILANIAGQDTVGILGNVNVAFYTWISQLDWPTPSEGDGYPAVVEDMRGATIGVTARGAEVELFTRALLEDAGLNPDTDVTFVGVGAGASAIGAFKAKQVDVLVAFEPSQTLLIDVDGVAKPILDLRAGEGPEVFANWPGQLRGARRSEAEGDPEPFARYQRAMMTGFEFMTDTANKDRVVEIYSEYIDLERPVLEAIYDNNVDTIGPSFDCEAYDNVAKFVVDTGQAQAADVPACEEIMWNGGEPYLENYEG